MNIKYDKNDPNLFGEVLKALRKEHGFSQTAVAEYLEVDRSTYTKYELGRLPDIPRLAKLSSLYGISADSMISVFFPDEENGFSRTAELGSDDNDSRICILTKEERLIIEYYRKSLRKSAIIDAVQNTYFSDIPEGIPEESEQDDDI